MNNRLEILTPLLIQQGFPAEFIPRNNGQLVDQLHVPFNFNEPRLNANIELTLASQLNPDFQSELQAEKLQTFDFLQYFLLFPVDCPQHNLIDLVRLVTMVNNGLPLVGFGVSEAQRRVFYRHMQLTLDEALNPEQVSITLNSIEYMVNTLGSALLDLCEDRRTLQQIVSDDIYWG